MEDKVLQLRSYLKNPWNPREFAKRFPSIFNKPPITLKKGSILFNEGEQLQRILFIQEGFVKLYRLSEEGKETTVYLLGPGYIGGMRALMAPGETVKHSAEALTNLKIYTVSHNEYLEKATEHPDLLVDLVHMTIDRLDFSEMKLRGFIHGGITHRVAAFLEDVAKRFGIKKDSSIVFPVEFTHQRIAEFIGSFRETVTHAVQELEKNKVIEVKKGIITIINPQELKKLATIPKKNK